AIRRKAGYLAENHGVRQRGEERLEEVPGRPEDGLLVWCDEVSLDEKADQIAAAPQLTKPPVEPPAACGNHREVVGFTPLDHFARATSPFAFDPANQFSKRREALANPSVSH